MIRLAADLHALQRPPSPRLLCLQHLHQHHDQVQHQQASAHPLCACQVRFVCVDWWLVVYTKRLYYWWGINKTDTCWAQIMSVTFLRRPSHIAASMQILNIGITIFSICTARAGDNLIRWSEATLCESRGVWLFVCVCRYQGRREETNMVIINIKLLSGYILDKVSLKLVSSTAALN